MDTNPLPVLESLPIKEQVQLLVEVREEVAKKEQILEEARHKKQMLNEVIMTSLRNIGTSTFKGETHSVSISKSRRVAIVDEGSVIKFLRSKRLAKEYVEKIERLTASAPKAIEMMVAEGQEVAGTEIRESEWVSVRSIVQKPLVSTDDELKSFKARVAKERGK